MLDMIERRGLPKDWDTSHATFELLDHHIPVPLFEMRSPNRLKGAWDWLRSRASNGFLNAFTLFLMAGQKPFLGIPGLPSPKRRWSPQIFRAQSLSPDSWTAPLREHALQTYIKMNEAQSNGNLKALEALTQGRMLSETRKRVKSIGNDKLSVWKYHGEASPLQCLSVRSLDLNAFQETKLKKLIVAQALVKIDTMQSLLVYNKKTGQLVTSKGTPESPVRVTEYMVLERRMLADGVWYIRDQLYPGARVEHTALGGAFL